MLNNLKAVTFFLLGISKIAAQDLVGGPPSNKWEPQQIFGPIGNAAFRRGNGVFLTPDESAVVALSNDATVAAYKAGDGQNLWIHKPAAEADLKSGSGIAFSTNTLTPFMVYSVSDDTSTYVIARDMDGDILWESEPLVGEHAGSPVISSDSKYVYVTHNAEDRLTGYFTILSTAAVNGTAEVLVASSHSGAPFAPPGIFHDPDVGYYDATDGYDGFANTNDIVLWGLDIVAANTGVPNGATFAFQFPTTFDGEDFSDLGHFVTGDNRAFRTSLPPLITNDGRTAYYAGSRSQYYGWIGYFAKQRFYYTRGSSLKESFGQDPLWPGQPCYSLPVESTNVDGDPAIFAGSAWHEFFRVSHKHDDAIENVISEQTVLETSDVIYASPKVDPMKRVVYFVQKDGLLNQVAHDFTGNATEDVLWSMEIDDGVESNMALNEMGTVLYLISTKGLLHALQVAVPGETASPTPAPTPPPTPAPTAPLTPAPTGPPVDDTPAPTVAPVTPDTDDEPDSDGDDEPDSDGDDEPDSDGDDEPSDDEPSDDGDESGAAAQHMMFVTVAIVYSLFM